MRVTFIKGFKTALFFVSALLLLISPTLSGCEAEGAQAPDVMPDGFVYVTDAAPEILLEMRYFSAFNFVGERVDGYLMPVCITTRETAEALKAASDELDALGYVLKIYDAYRPTDAVSHFVRWAVDTSDTKMKEYFYPNLDKSVLFSLGYIARKSGHSRGSTVDLTIVDKKTGRDVDMGSPFDFFGDISSHGTQMITSEQAANRLILKSAMENVGFKAYSKEWWHYTLKEEPFPDTYFNFPVK